MVGRIPDGAAVAELAEALKDGGWRCFLHVSLRDGQHRYCYRSAVDARVTLLLVKAKGGRHRVRDYHFTTTAYRPAFELGDHTRFTTLEALAAAVLRHDREEAEEREWQRASPGGGAAA